jgi:hypothetical protein
MTLQHNLNAVQDPYRAVSLVLLVAAILGMWAAFVGGIKLTNPAMLASGITLGLAALILAGVLKAQAAHRNPLAGALAQSVAVLAVVANSARVLRFSTPQLNGNAVPAEPGS